MDVLVWVRSHPRLMRLPVIVYTTSILPEEKKAAQRLGATQFITKTAHCNEILATLAHCLDCRLMEPICFSRCPGSNPTHLVH
jgi:CheY-like chemotaxis protein